MDTESAWDQILACMEGEVVALDSGIDPLEIRMLGEDRREIDLTGQRGVNGDGSQSKVGDEPIFQSLASSGRVVRGVTNHLPHGFAELGFRGDGCGNCHLPRF